jgi:hypothetical protein
LGPALLPTFEEGGNQVVLRGEVPVECCLGHPGTLDQLIDADIPDATAREQLVRRIEDSIPRAGLDTAAGFLRLYHAHKHTS